MMLVRLRATTPPTITSLVNEFCATFSQATPEYVPVKPEGEAGYCHPNVKKKIEKDGGEVVYGRMIWLSEALIEAEWHAVWQKDGTLVDVTAKPDHEERILFVRTDEEWDGKSVFPNIRRLLTDDPTVHQFVAMQEAMERTARRLDDGRLEFDLAPAIRTMLRAFSLRGLESGPPLSASKLKAAPPGFRKHYTGRNDPCPCGSGRKFKKCCMFAKAASKVAGEFSISNI